MGTDKIGIEGKTRPVSSLFSRQSTGGRPAGTDAGAKLQDPTGAAKPRPKRCLNEAGHKLDR